jgi:hypothetical protein
MMIGVSPELAMVHRRAYDNLNQSRFAGERGLAGGWKTIQSKQTSEKR